MQLSITTDYAIRTILYLAMKGEIAATTEIGEAMNISPNYLAKITKKLKQKELIQVQKGASGGFCLNRQPKDITLLDIIQCTEPSIKINRCIEEDSYCNRNAAKTCPVHKSYQIIQNEIEKRMSEITVHDLIHGK